MTTLVEQRAQAPAQLGRGSLLRTELLRFRCRRMVQVLLGLGLLGLLGGAALAATQYTETSPAVLAQAAENRDQSFAETQRYHAQCLTSVGTGNGPTTEQDCGPVPTVEDVPRVEDWIATPPFTLAGPGRDGLLGVAAATAALAFLLGATFVGAEWSTRSMVALLFWEPRRWKVMAAKLAVLTAATAAYAALVLGLWLLAARVLAATRGGVDPPDGIWGELLAGAGRGVLLVVLVGLLGFGVANLMRNTAAAFGFGFVYFAIVENVIRVLRPAWQPWLITDNAVALLTQGGLRIFINDDYIDERGVYQFTGREILVSNLHGGLLLALVTAVVLAAGIILFTRRDLS